MAGQNIVKPAANRSRRVHQQTNYPGSTFFPFYFGISLLKLNIRKKGTLVIEGLLGNLANGFDIQGLGFRDQTGHEIETGML